LKPIIGKEEASFGRLPPKRPVWTFRDWPRKISTK